MLLCKYALGRAPPAAQSAVVGVDADGKSATHHPATVVEDVDHGAPLDSEQRNKIAAYARNFSADRMVLFCNLDPMVGRARAPSGVLRQVLKASLCAARCPTRKT